MKLNYLKRIRVIISVIFFILITWTFVNIYQVLSTGFIGSILYLQFLPSLIKFIRLPVLAATGFIFVLILTVLFGRIYCSSICPMGTFQDFVNYISNKIKRKKRKYTKPHNVIRHSILILTAISFLFGIMFLINLFDPYSMFGRLIDGTLKHGVINTNNELVKILQKFNIYFLSPFEIKAPKTEPLILTLVLIVTVVFFSVFKGRLWCNTVCPVGSILSLISKYSIFKLIINEHTCTNCGLCAKTCKAYCIDDDAKKIDMDRCINCYNCVRVCRSDSITYKYDLQTNSFKKQIDISTTPISQVYNSVIPANAGISSTTKQEIPAFAGMTNTLNVEIPAIAGMTNTYKAEIPAIAGVTNTYKAEIPAFAGMTMGIVNLNRRKLVLGSFLGLTGLAINAISKTESLSANNKEPEFFTRKVVVPPGAKSYKHFTHNCTACHLCVSACPTNVLQSSFLEYGLSGIFQPRMDYITSFCNYECTVCGNVCPSGAILPLKKVEKTFTQVGKAHLNKKECICYKEDKVCGACSEHCPTKSVNMVPYKNIMAPEVTDKYCVGCGACEFACPTKPKKSIFVVANQTHQKAVENKSKKAVQKPVETGKKEEDFPF